MRDDAADARGRCDEEMIRRIEWIVLAGGSRIVATADDSSWHHVFATWFQDDDYGGDVGAGTICRGDAVMRVITRVQAATGSAFWSSVKGLTAQVTILISAYLCDANLVIIASSAECVCVKLFEKLEIIRRCGSCKFNRAFVSNL